MIYLLINTAEIRFYQLVQLSQKSGPKAKRMIQSLLGTRTRIQEIERNNFINSFQSKVTKSTPLLPNSNPSCLRNLGNMLTTRNKKYQNNNYNTYSYHGVGFPDFKAKATGGCWGHQQYKQDRMEGQGQGEIQYGIEDLDKEMEDIGEKFVKFGIGSSVGVIACLDRGTVDWELINTLGTALRKTNLTNPPQNKSQTLLHSLPFPSTTPSLSPNTPLLTYLLPQLLVSKQHPQTPITHIFSSLADNALPQLPPPVLSPVGLLDERETVLLLVRLLVGEGIGDRVGLKRVLFGGEGGVGVVRGVGGYDRIVGGNGKEQHGTAITIQDIKTHNTQLTQSSPTPIQWLLSFGWTEGDQKNWQSLLSGDYGTGPIIEHILNMKIWRWGQVPIKNQQAIKYQHMIRENYAKMLPYVLRCRNGEDGEKGVWDVRCLNFGRECLGDQGRYQGLLGLLVLVVELEATTNLLIFSREQPTYFSQQLYKQLKQLCSLACQPSPSSSPSSSACSPPSTPISCLSSLLSQTLPYLPHPAPLLLKNPLLLPHLDWQHALSLLPSCSQSSLLSQLIPASIQIYHNTTTFLNSNIPIYQILPFFQIQILVQGLAIVLREGGRFGGNQGARVWGMVSLYRREKVGYLYGMSLMEMLVQCYIIKESKIQSDYKSLALCLRCNLQNPSPSPTQPQPPHPYPYPYSHSHSPSQLHNQAYLNNLHTQGFLQILNKRPNDQILYINYLWLLGQSICKLKVSRQKIIRSSKIDYWADLLLDRINTVRTTVGAKFERKLDKLRDAIIRMFSSAGL